MTFLPFYPFMNPRQPQIRLTFDEFRNLKPMHLAQSSLEGPTLIKGKPLIATLSETILPNLQQI